MKNKPILKNKKLKGGKIMKKTFIFALCFILMAAGSSALFSMSRPAEEKTGDETLERVIDSALLLDEFVSSHLIDVSVSEGVATLTGSVSNILQKDRAEEITSTIKGVRGIVNRIKVNVSIKDSTIKKNINKAVLYDPAIEGADVKADVEGGEVTLSGAAESWTEKLLAEEVVKGVKGVKKVTNKISVDYKDERPDNEIREEIIKRMKLDPYIDHELFTVETDNGHVVLKGAAGTLAEKTRAAANSWVNGVKSVETSGVTVRRWAKDVYERKDPFVFKGEEEIKEAVKDTLYYDPRVFSGDIKVKTDPLGNVTLTGKVFDLRAKKAAKTDARNVPGVKTVRNYVKVRPVSPPPDYTIEDNVEEALLFDPVIERYEINVDVINNKVFLSGTVDADYERLRAGDIAGRIGGVIDVDNNIDVASEWTWKSDAEIKNDLENRLEWNIYTDESDLSVEVEEGIVTIDGKAATWKEFNEAVEAGFDAGAKNVVTDIDITGYGDMPVTFYERYYYYQARPWM